MKRRFLQRPLRRSWTVLKSSCGPFTRESSPFHAFFSFHIILSHWSGIESTPWRHEWIKTRAWTCRSFFVAGILMTCSPILFYIRSYHILVASISHFLFSLDVLMCLVAGLSMRRRREVSPLRFFLAMISVGKSPFAKTLQANKSTEPSLLIRFVYRINWLYFDCEFHSCENRHHWQITWWNCILWTRYRCTLLLQTLPEYWEIPEAQYKISIIVFLSQLFCFCLVIPTLFCAYWQLFWSAIWIVRVSHTFLFFPCI